MYNFLEKFKKDHAVTLVTGYNLSQPSLNLKYIYNDRITAKLLRRQQKNKFFSKLQYVPFPNM